MRDAYPELMESVQRVARVVKDEEHRYATTFQVAEKVFQDEAKAAAHGALPGAAAGHVNGRTRSTERDRDPFAHPKASSGNDRDPFLQHGQTPAR